MIDIDYTPDEDEAFNVLSDRLMQEQERDKRRAETEIDALLHKVACGKPDVDDAFELRRLFKFFGANV